LHVATCPHRGVWVRGAVEVEVDHRDGGKVALERLRAAGARRAVGRTGLNADSSRSHLIVGFRVETSKETAATPGIEPGTSRSSAKLFLVDLAGCEKAAKSLAAGDRLDEAKGINKSLSALGNVVSALVEGDRVGAFGGNPPVGGSSPDGADEADSPSGASKSGVVPKQTPPSTHVPYRDSKLTFLLQESLGGNARATLVVCLSPDVADTAETISSLRFGARARRVSARLERGNRSVAGSIPGGGAAEIAALRAQVATLTRELAASAAASRGRIEATGSVDAGDLATKFSKFSKNDALSGRVRARGGGVLDALTATLGDGSARFAIRGDVGGRNEGWAAPIVAGVALSLLFQAIDKIAAA